MAVFKLDDKEICFPLPELADPDGLLAIGGDLCFDRLLLAYTHGIFPWYNPGEDIMWWCPKQRFIIRPQEIHISHSMKKFMKKHDVCIRLNRDFRSVMHNCRSLRENTEEGTWISDEIEEAYYDLYQKGYALCVESYIDGQLAGGLYGVVLGRCFMGESMFSHKENGSKIALILLAQILEHENFLMIDCQLHTDHLESMGGVYISYDEYMTLIKQGLS